MRFLILDTYYDEFIRLVYQSHPDLNEQPYAEQLQTIYDSGFARIDFLPQNLRRLGHDAEQLIVNAIPLQRRWAEEHGLRLPPLDSSRLLSRLGYAPQRIYRGVCRRLGLASLVQANRDWLTRVIAAQVEEFEPDVVFNCDLPQFPSDFLRHIKGRTRYLIGECGYPISPDFDLSPYDLLVSCVPHNVKRFRTAGLTAQLLRHGFEPAILQKLGTVAEREGIIFIGSVGARHQRRLQLLEAVSRHVPLQCWSPVSEKLPLESPLIGRIHPPLWGYDMYRRLQQAQMTINIHIDIADDFAGNMRLFEATGVGTLLITDWKENLHEMFDPGKEVVAYRTSEECIELIQYYLNHDSEREAIACSGQQRTLREHTYYHRMQELVAIINKYL